MLLHYGAIVIFDVEKEIERSREKLPRGIPLTDRSVEFNEVRILPYAFTLALVVNVGPQQYTIAPTNFATRDYSLLLPFATTP